MRVAFNVAWYLLKSEVRDRAIREGYEKGDEEFEEIEAQKRAERAKEAGETRSYLNDDTPTLEDFKFMENSRLVAAQNQARLEREKVQAIEDAKRSKVKVSPTTMPKDAVYPELPEEVWQRAR